VRLAAGSALAVCLAWPVAAAAGGAEPPGTPEGAFVHEQVQVPIFGTLDVYRPEPVQGTRGVALFVSGDGGWKQGVVEMALRSAPRVLVVGIPMPAWSKRAAKEKEGCWYPAGELESIAQAVEKSYRLPRYIRPILIGYSSGATLVYGALAQAPAGAFDGAISLGFCPDLDVGRPFCGHTDWKPSYDAKKKVSILPPRSAMVPREDGRPRWTVLQGQMDKVCDSPRVTRFAEQVPGSRVVPLAKVGHGFSVSRYWGEAYDAAVADLLAPVTAWEPLPEEARHLVRNYSPAAIRDRLEALDLPLEVQWPDDATEVVIFVSGDGGWAELDQRVAGSLAGRGVAVVGWNALRYFWEPKTPEDFLADLERVVAALPGDVRVSAGGYSFGAEVIPAALASRRPGREPQLERIAALVLLAPGPYASFEVSPLDWVRSNEPRTDHPVRRALEGLDGRPILCLEPSDHDPSGCPDGTIPGLTRVPMPGGHHFAGDYDGLSDRILEFLKKAPSGN
jgi:type IV secretory pathway VirJ component